MKKAVLLFAFSILYTALSAIPLIVKTKYTKECSVATEECTEYVLMDVFFEFDPVDSKTIVVTGDGPSFTLSVIDFEVKKDESNVITTQFTCSGDIFIVYQIMQDENYHLILATNLKMDKYRVYSNKIE